MKNLIFSYFLLLGLCMNSALAQEAPDAMMSNLIKTLDLSEKQQIQVSALANKFRTNVNYILMKNEGEEEPDVGVMISEIRKERDTFREDLQGILSPNQYDLYLTKVDAVFTDIFNDLANIRLLEIQDQVDLTDKQIESLTPIISRSMSQTVRLLFENAGTKLTLPKKIKLGKKMKKIEKVKRAAMEGILTPDQMAIYDKLKEEQKAARKGK